MRNCISSNMSSQTSHNLLHDLTSSMLTPIQIKEDMEHALQLFSPGEEEHLFKIIRHEARYGSNFFAVQSSDFLQKVFKVNELKYELKVLVRKFHLFTVCLRKNQYNDFSFNVMIKDYLGEFRLNIQMRIGQWEVLTSSNCINIDSIQRVLRRCVSLKKL